MSGYSYPALQIEKFKFCVFASFLIQFDHVPITESVGVCACTNMTSMVLGSTVTLDKSVPAELGLTY